MGGVSSSNNSNIIPGKHRQEFIGMAHTGQQWALYCQRGHLHNSIQCHEMMPFALERSMQIVEMMPCALVAQPKRSPGLLIR